MVHPQTVLALWGSQFVLRPVKGESEIPVLAGIPAWDPSWDPRPSERYLGDSGSRGIPAWDPSWDPGHRWDPALHKKLATMLAIAKLAKAMIATAKLAKSSLQKAKLAKAKLAKPALTKAKLPTTTKLAKHCLGFSLRCHPSCDEAAFLVQKQNLRFI